MIMVGNKPHCFQHERVLGLIFIFCRVRTCKDSIFKKLNMQNIDYEKREQDCLQIESPAYRF